MTTPNDPARCLDRAFRRLAHSGWVVTLVCSLLACGAPVPETTPPRGGTDPQVAPAPPVTATLPDGWLVHLELALTTDEISRGLMFRPSLPADRGMLFLFSETQPLVFWMKNTRIPLDIVFLDEQGLVVRVEHNALPCAAEPCPQYLSRSPSRAVLELAAGVAAERGVEQGAAIRFAGVPGYPLERGAP